MAHVKSFIAAERIQDVWVFRVQLVEDWNDAPSPRWATCWTNTAR